MITSYTGTDAIGQISVMSKIVTDKTQNLPLCRVVEGGEYTVTMYYKSNASRTATMTLGDTSETLNFEPTWNRLQKVYDLKASDYIDIELPQGTYYLWHTQIEKGNKATDWSKSPKDFENDIEVLSKEIVNTKASIEILKDSIGLNVKKTVEVGNRVTETESDLKLLDNSITAMTKTIDEMGESLGKVEIEAGKVNLLAQFNDETSEITLTAEMIDGIEKSDITLTGDQIHLNGDTFIGEGFTLSADNINVDDLSAFNATIGGFDIKDNSIASKVTISDDKFKELLIDSANPKLQLNSHDLVNGDRYTYNVSVAPLYNGEGGIEVASRNETLGTTQSAQLIPQGLLANMVEVNRIYSGLGELTIGNSNDNLDLVGKIKENGTLLSNKYVQYTDVSNNVVAMSMTDGVVGDVNAKSDYQTLGGEKVDKCFSCSFSVSAVKDSTSSWKNCLQIPSSTRPTTTVRTTANVFDKGTSVFVGTYSANILQNGNVSILMPFTSKANYWVVINAIHYK